jgi:hypothetical protein
MVVNRIEPIVRTEIAKLTAQKPFASVIPASSDDNDLAAAQAAEQVWESVSSREGLRMQFENAIFWTSITGNGFVKTWWDKNETGDDGVPGDIEFSAVTPFHLFVPDLRETDIQEQLYVINAYTRPWVWVNQFFKGKAEELGIRAQVRASQDIVDDVVIGLQSNEAEPDSVMLIELWAKGPVHKDLPNGGRVVCTSDGKILSIDQQGMPYTHGDYPFAHFGHIPTGKFYRRSVIESIVPLQRELNRKRSQIVEAANKMARPQLMAPKGSVDARKITTEPGLLIEYVPGLPPPQPLPLQPLPSYVLEEVNRLQADIEDLSGQHQVSRGVAPSGITAGTALNYLQEADDTMLATTISSIERGWETVAKQTLALCVQYWDVPRTVKVTGIDSSFDAQQLLGSDIKSGTDIRMEGGSALPTSKAAKQSLIMDMMTKGFIDPKDGMSVLEIGGTQTLFSKLRVDESQAQRENIKLRSVDPNILDQINQQQDMLQQQAAMQGGQLPPISSIVPVNTWDQHDIHVEVHNRFRKTQAFESLPDTIKAEFEKHVNLHLQEIQTAMMQVQQFGPGAPQQSPDAATEGMPGEMGTDGTGGEPAELMGGGGPNG